ncbi:MAG: hypothetical protein ACREQ9_02905 [Candidatus Binatia bacterium]
MRVSRLGVLASSMTLAFSGMALAIDSELVCCQGPGTCGVAERTECGAALPIEQELCCQVPLFASCLGFGCDTGAPGVCAAGTYQCQPDGDDPLGQPQLECVQTDRGPCREVCYDGLDNDCDGFVDDGCHHDVCDRAEPITLEPVGTTTIRGSTTEATPSGQRCGAGGDVFFRIEIDTPTLLYVDTFGSSYDTTVGLARSCGEAPVCNDNAPCGNTDSRKVRLVDPGRHYIVVGGLGPEDVGDFQLNIQHLPVSSATGLAGREIPSGPFSFTGSTLNLTSAFDPQTCDAARFNASPDDWFYFLTCPGFPGGTLFASTCHPESDYDTVLGFRNGDGQPCTNGFDSGAAARRSCGGEEQDFCTGEVPPFGEEQNQCTDDARQACGLSDPQKHFTEISASVSAGPGIHVLYVDGWEGAAGSFKVSGANPAP